MPPLRDPHLIVILKLHSLKEGNVACRQALCPHFYLRSSFAACIPATNKGKRNLLSYHLYVVAHFRLIHTLVSSLPRAYDVAQNIFSSIELLYIYGVQQTPNRLAISSHRIRLLARQTCNARSSIEMFASAREEEEKMQAALKQQG